MLSDKAGSSKPRQLEAIDNSGSKEELLHKIRSMGISTEPFESCTLEQIKHLAGGVMWLKRTYDEESSSGEIEESPQQSPANTKTKNTGFSSSGDARGFVLTAVDKRMLQTLLASSGRVSSLALSRKLEIPLTTIQRRRKRLESEFLEVAYSLKLDKLGWRKADLLISTSSGRASAIGKELLSNNAITRVCRSIGEHTIDLHAEIVFKNNTELLHVIEWIKALEGVSDVVWTEPVEVVGKKDRDVLEKVLHTL